MSLVDPVPRPRTPINTVADRSDSGYESLLSQAASIQLRDARTSRAAPGQAIHVSSHVAGTAPAEAGLAGRRATGFNGLFSFDKPGVCIKDYVEVQSRIDEGLMSSLKRSEGPPVSLRLGILGKSLQDARPHLIIFCSKKQAKRAESFLKKTRIKKLLESEDLAAGPLRVIVCDQAPTLTVFAEYRNIHIATSGPWTPLGSSSCGLPIRIYSSGTGQFRKSTLGGIIRVTASDGSSEIFGITAGHPFEQYRDDSAEPGSGSDSDDSDSSNMSGSNGSVQSVVHETSNAWEFQGFHECQAILSPITTQHGDAQDHYWDWTLIKLRDWQPNRVRNGDGWQMLTEPAKDFRQRALHRKVEMLSASSGPVSGSLYFAGSKLCISPGRKSIETFIFEPQMAGAIENGDSGSWVVDLQTREVYGHVVAADCFGGAYVVPIDALFCDIKKRLEAASVELPSYYKSLPYVFQDFRTFVQKSQQLGEYGDGTPAKYMSPQKLAEYWTADKIERSLELDSPRREDQGAIERLKGRYMVVFSILAYISKVGHSATSYIDRFIAMGQDDNAVPFQSMPSALVGLPYGSQVYADFSATQCMFQPLIIQQKDAPKRYLDLRTGRILAAKSLGKPPESVPVTDEEVVISCPLDTTRNESEKTTVILKSYPEDALAFRHDLDTWSLIQKLKQPDQHIISIIDAFNLETPSGDRKILVTERPELGTLLDLFRQNSPPYTQEDVRMYWSSILSLIGTINVVHRQMQSNLHLRFCDLLSPSDILVFTENNTSNGSVYRLKLNMLAGNRFRTGKAAVSIAYHERGAYYAPELSHEGSFQDNSPADVWSLGCLAVEVASWLIGGERGRIDFHNSRKHEIEGFPKNLRDQLVNCFHDGENTLNSVRNVYKLATKYSRRSDDITSGIVGAFLRGALVGSPARRFPARQLQMSVQMILDGELEGGTSSRRSSTCRDDTFDMKHRVSTSYFSGPRSHASSRTSLVSAQYVANSHPAPLYPQISPSITQKSVRDSSVYSVGSHEKGIRPSRQLLFNRHDKEGATFSQARFPLLAPQGVERSKPLSPLSTSAPVPIDSGVVLSSGKAATSGYQLYPHVTLKEVVKWIDEKKKASRGSVRGFRQGQLSLPGQELALQTLSNRDMIFLVDNSTTMQAYKDEVIDSFHALAYLAKQVDSDGIDVFLSSRPDSRLQARNTSSLVKYVQSHFSPGRPDFGLGPCLQKVAADIMSTSNLGRKSSKTKGISLYILTDGVWDQSDTIVIHKSIQMLGDEITRRKLRQTDITIQFIRFGDSTAAARRLQYLDDDLSIANYDIVDTKSCKDNVWSILVGSIAESTDVAKNESDDERIDDIVIDS